MSKVTFGKTEARKIAAIIDPEYKTLDKEMKETVEGIAKEVLAAALDLVLSRASYTVVGQLRRAPEGRWTGPGEAEASKGCLGFYSTPGDAQAAAESLVYNNSTHEEWATWVLPVSHCSAAEFHAERKKAKAVAAAEELARMRAAADPAHWARERAEEIEEVISSLPTKERQALEHRIAVAEIQGEYAKEAR